MPSQQAHTRPTRPPVVPFQSLDGVASTGPGSELFLAQGFGEFSVQLVGTGTTEATVQLQAALVSSGITGTTDVWQQLGSNVTYSDTGNGAITLVSSTVPVTAVRLNVSAFTTGTSTATDALSGWVVVK